MVISSNHHPNRLNVDNRLSTLSELAQNLKKTGVNLSGHENPGYVEAIILGRKPEPVIMVGDEVLDNPKNYHLFSLVNFVAGGYSLKGKYSPDLNDFFLPLAEKTPALAKTLHHLLIPTIVLDEDSSPEQVKMFKIFYDLTFLDPGYLSVEDEERIIDKIVQISKLRYSYVYGEVGVRRELEIVKNSFGTVLGYELRSEKPLPRCIDYETVSFSVSAEEIDLPLSYFEEKFAKDHAELEEAKAARLKEEKEQKRQKEIENAKRLLETQGFSVAKG